MTKPTVLLLLFFMVAGVPPLRAQTPQDRRAILAVLDRQVADWNAGNVEAFMRGYWASDSLTFVGKAGVTYGYAATLANYRRRYPDRASMGTLRFEIVRLYFPARRTAYVIGRWHLTRPQVGDAGGSFTLLWRRLGRR